MEGVLWRWRGCCGDGGGAVVMEGCCGDGGGAVVMEGCCGDGGVLW